MRTILFTLLALASLTARTFAAEPSPTIAWEKNVVDAFATAAEQQKPIVVLFAHRPSFKGANGRSFSNELWMEFDHKPLRALAGQAVFVTAYFDDESARMIDDKAEILRSKLGVDTLPTISVIAPNVKRLVEVRKIVGHSPAEAIAKDLRVWLPKALESEALAPAVFAR